MCCGIVRIVEDIGKVGGGNDWCQNLEGKNKLFIWKEAAGLVYWPVPAGLVIVS